MNKTAKLLVTSVIAASLFGGTNVLAAASLSKDGLKSNSGQIMTDVSTHAGSGDFGSANGNKLLSNFRNPVGLLVRHDGTLIVSDEKNHLLRIVSGNNVGTYAGLILKKDAQGFLVGGLLDGTRDAALFLEPSGLAMDAAGNLYVADAGNNAIRKIDAIGKITTIAGNGRIGDRDGIGTETTFQRPQDIAVAMDGTVYVADTLNHRIRKISPTGQVSTLSSPSERVVEVFPGLAVPAGDFLDGDIAKAKFNEPTGLAIDAKGNLYVSDSGNQRIRYIDFGTGKVTTVAGGGAYSASSVYEPSKLYAQGDLVDGDALKAKLNYPMGIAVTEEGGLIIADSGNRSIRYLYGGKLITLAGQPSLLSGEWDGSERTAQFHKPTDVAVGPNGSIYIADAFNNKVRRLDLYHLPADLPVTDEVKVVLETLKITFDVQPEIVNDRVTVPVRAIAEALGYTVDFQSDKRIVQLAKGGSTIELPIEDEVTDNAPYMKQNRTLVPVRFFAEKIGLDVQWDPATRTVIIRQ